MTTTTTKTTITTTTTTRMTTTTTITAIPAKKRQNQEILIRPLDTFAGHAVRGFQRSVHDNHAASTAHTVLEAPHQFLHNQHTRPCACNACHRVCATARANARTLPFTTSSTHARARWTPKQSSLALSQLRAYAQRRPEVGLRRGEERERGGTTR